MIDNHGLELPITTIVVNNMSDTERIDKGGFLRIGREKYEILPLHSSDGTLFVFTDNKSKKGALVRVRRNSDAE